MRIAQISDTHILRPGLKTYGIAPMAENLNRCIKHINALSLKPDIVLLSGNITNDFARNGAQHAADILTALDCSYYLVPGNHDDRNEFWDVFGKTACPARLNGFINYVIDDNALRIIALNTLWNRQAGGMVCETRAA